MLAILWIGWSIFGLGASGEVVVELIETFVLFVFTPSFIEQWMGGSFDEGLSNF